ncbi:MAG: methylmalonyl Co-A mutase-associated GTPase MeaB [Geminicoccaceae bacterium]|nr:methylmalonyl Co-A mutase-associated GTPase MeaB [Geminicoccaceae bacterium]
MALARLLARLDATRLDGEALDLLDAAWRAPRAQVVGLTGPPGVGKSTLVSVCVRHWRRAGRRVAVVAVDPSSRRTQGAILGDRTRLELDPEDAGVFVRSVAARDRLGGLATVVLPTVVVLRALFDIVLVETVGVGQSETEIRDVADTVVLAVQPASGDSLQFIKAGIVEIPDIAVVTKADMTAHADRTRRELLSVLRVQPDKTVWCPAIETVSAATGDGIERLLERIDAHHRHLTARGDLAARRHAQACLWLETMLRQEVGRRGLESFAAALAALRGDMTRPPLRGLAWLEP